MKITDIAWDTGVSTILLAKELEANITSVDLLPEFLDELQSSANNHGVAHRIATPSSSTDALPVAEGGYFRV